MHNHPGVGGERPWLAATPFEGDYHPGRGGGDSSGKMDKCRKWTSGTGCPETELFAVVVAFCGNVVKSAIEKLAASDRLWINCWAHVNVNVTETLAPQTQAKLL